MSIMNVRIKRLKSKDADSGSLRCVKNYGGRWLEIELSKDICSESAF